MGARSDKKLQASTRPQILTLSDEGTIMSTDYERRLLARARELADVGELAETVTGILGGARAAGLDPDALGGLVGAATALGADSLTVYTAGRGIRSPFPDEGAFAAAVGDAEDDIAERLQAAGRIQEQVIAAIDAAMDALESAQAMPVRDPCDGCHGRRAAAIDAARKRIALCEDTIIIVDALTRRLAHALARLRAVPGDLGETYVSVYNLVRRGGSMPHEGRWITGQEAATA